MPTPTTRRPRVLPRALRRALHRTSRPRAVVLLATAALATGLLVGAVPASADPTPPPNPTDAQIGGAQAQKTALAAQVGALTAQLSQQAVQVQQLDAAAELAEQDYAYAMQQLADAKTAATAAKQAVASAQAEVDKAHAAFNATVRANYTQASVQGGAGALLASNDPDEVLQSAAFQAYVTDHQADGIGQLDRAKVAKANADAAARAAVDTQTAATARADQALQAAQAAESAARTKQQALAAAQASTKTKLAAAYNQLQTLLGQRQTYNQYVAEQARIAAQKAAEERARVLAQQRAAAIALAQQQAAQAASGNSGGNSGGGGSSSGGGGGGSSGDPSGGSWTAAKGQEAVNRAMQWIGERYSYAGGTYDGPTLGFCSDDAGWNDCHIVGFDCSGLMMFAWAPYIHLAHKAMIQYTQAGSYHPSVGDLQPGDMLFYGGSQDTIHHVAMYIGNGMVVQAPQSGELVKTTSIWNMGSDYYGATRPLT